MKKYWFKLKNLLFLGLLVSSTHCLGQIMDSSITVHSISVTYSLQNPSGELSERFGVSNTFGLNYFVKFKSNWTLGFEVLYLFGNQVREDNIFDSIKTSNGELISKDGEYSRIVLTERGMHADIRLGKVFTIGTSMPNSGILFNLGLGFLQHKINIENDGLDTPQIIGDYTKGYDRLTNGLSLTEFIGYLHYGKNKMFNVYAGFEFIQAWTKNRRDYNFNTMERDDHLRKDYLYSFKVGWIIPVYQRTPDKFYTY